ncbi:serine/threonine-protein kinase [Nocardioides sp. cx-173]|uniref:serine/threonine-protein kinase n=1 Tax=Nocardioides sp. cx-173 TaxID=2898796 RepID=UPI001E3C3E20|nr:serine/threonine-protein kinase [Nocardioides sp. cx-173]MCD4524701.1 serine/threonine protein kinase [Nocardioides sp. cx-173]UGB43211.1 serine/threonine protein kinase [Nocardioides sp. cx-173]
MSELPVTPLPRAGAPSRDRVGPYTLLSKIGEGGMGVVHLARQDGGPRVALKMLRPHIVGDDEARARFAREVNSLQRIRSRWVAEIVDADPWAPVPYVATRYVPGLSLHDHVVEEGPIEGPNLIWFAGCLAEGLASVHAVGVLHRDIKPSNVLMEGRTPILIDFGLARVADDPKLTHTGWLLGTPGYLAPEILYGDDATAASDIHSWAATVAYAGTGNPPFGRGPSMAIMDRVRRGQHDLTGLPYALRQLVEAALDPEPERRPDLDAILGWLRPQTTGPRTAVPPVPTGPEDIFTIPLALAGAQAAEAPTAVEREEPRPTRVLPQEPRVDPQPWAQEWAQEWQEPAPPPQVGFGERVRRATLLGGAAVALGAGLSLAPWVVAALVCLVVWLLRSGSLAASAAGDRRLRRGRRWYDGPQVLLGAPWHLVQSVGGTLMLLTWSAGLAVSAALVGYALAASVQPMLFVMGLVLAVSLWWGPGGSRVRRPVSRVVHPLARTQGAWSVAMVALLVLAAGLGLRAAGAGTTWSPAQDQPFASYTSSR